MGRHGGARPGAGRKPKSVRFRTKINAADKLFADGLKKAATKLLELAEGGFETIEREYLPAGLVTVKIDTVSDSGKVERGLERLAFPDLDETELVCVKEKRSQAMPDRTALVYICNRILGRPFAEPAPVEESDDADGFAELPDSEGPDVEPSAPPRPTHDPSRENPIESGVPHRPGAVQPPGSGARPLLVATGGNRSIHLIDTRDIRSGR